jgi:hypothetical protein
MQSTLTSFLVFFLFIITPSSGKGVKSNFIVINFKFDINSGGSSSLSKRGIGCDELAQPSTEYKNNNATWELLCGQSFDVAKLLQVTYTSKFSDCLNACQDFDQSAPCLGVQYGPGNGTAGEPSSLNICYLMWDMINLNKSSRSSDWDSAQLKVSNSSTVCTYCSMNLLFIGRYLSEWNIHFPNRCQIHLHL